MTLTKTEEPWDLIIEPKRKLLDIPIREVIRYRDLIALFIKRDFVTQYKQTILGPLWFIINPLISTVMYAFVFGNLAKLSTDGVPHILFYYAGTMLWTFFAGCFTDATNIFVNNGTVVKRDIELVKWFVQDMKHLFNDDRIEILIDNKDLGVFEQ